MRGEDDEACGSEDARGGSGEKHRQASVECTAAAAIERRREYAAREFQSV
jgi:hypothetical protein